MRKFLLALALLSISVSSRQPSPSSSRAAVRRTSRRPAPATSSSHCRPVIDQGDFTILACLKENRSKISAACDQVLQNHGQ